MEKPFVVGGVKFTAIRKTGPRPCWMLKIDESGQIFDPANGVWFKHDTVPTMIADIEETFKRSSGGDEAAWRRSLGIATPA